MKADSLRARPLGMRMVAGPREGRTVWLALCAGPRLPTAARPPAAAQTHVQAGWCDVQTGTRESLVARRDGKGVRRRRQSRRVQGGSGKPHVAGEPLVARGPSKRRHDRSAGRLPTSKSQCDEKKRKYLENFHVNDTLK